MQFRKGGKIMNRFNLFLAVFSLMFPDLINGQAWQIAWNKQFGNNKMDYFTDVVEDINGGFAVLGSTLPAGHKSYEFWLLRFNENGDTIWTKTLGTDFDDFPKKIIQDADGGYLILGMSKDSDSEKVILIKTNTDGVEKWRKTFEDENFYIGQDIVSDGENGFLLVGSKSPVKEKPNRWLAKIDDNGKVPWEKSYSGDQMGLCKAVKRLPVGGYVIAGQVQMPGKKLCDSWITRLDKNCEPIWSSQISSTDVKSWPECVCCSPDSFLMMVGWQGSCMNDINSADPIFDFDLSLTRIDKNGKIVWTKNIKREGSEGGNSVAIRPDGKFVIAGIKQTSFLGKIGPWLLVVDSNGKEISENVIQLHCLNDQAAKVINCKDGGIVVVGPGIQDVSNIRSNGWIIKFSSF